MNPEKRERVLEELCNALSKLATSTLELERTEAFLGRTAHRGGKSLRAYEMVRRRLKDRKRKRADEAHLWLERLEDDLAAKP